MSWIIQSIIVIPLRRRRLYWYSQGLKIFPLQVWVSLGLLASERDPPNFNYWILQLKLAFEYNKTKYNQHKPVLKVNFPPASFGWQEILKNHQNSLLREELPAGAPIQVKFKSNHSLICLLPPESSSLSLISSSSTVTRGICLLIDKASSVTVTHTVSMSPEIGARQDWRLKYWTNLNWSELICVPTLSVVQLRRVSCYFAQAQQIKSQSAGLLWCLIILVAILTTKQPTNWSSRRVSFGFEVVWSDRFWLLF